MAQSYDQIARNDDDVWIPTSCHMCYLACPILVHRVNGVVVDLRGNPDSVQSRGKMCAKGKAGVMNLYNPNRATVPLKRTNPVKGIGVDPEFQEISWEEAISTIVDNFKAIREEDPKQLWVQAWSEGRLGQHFASLFGTAFGTPNIMTASAPSCGKAIHPIENMVTGGFHQEPDLHYCKYLILSGTQLAFSTRFNYVHNMKDMAEARARGMKIVLVDPLGLFTAAKADEWIPIRPGTDGAYALAIINVLLNDLDIYDRDFLKLRTNGPYLIKPDGLYVRDNQGKPMIWDPIDGRAKAFDSKDIKDYALLGEYTIVGGGQGEDRELGGEINCKPAFQLFKDHVKKFTPEYASEITTIPAQTIRRIAKEFGEAASIGSTIQIDGKTFPYRPVAVDWARGPQGHKHGFWQSWALKLINIVVGAIEVPGGMHGTGTSGNWPQTWSSTVGPDGLIRAMPRELGRPQHGGYPSHTSTKPIRQDLSELFPVAGHATTVYPLVIPNPRQYGLDYRTKASLHNIGNTFLGSFGDSKLVEKTFQSIPFVVTFSVEKNEVADMAEIVLPAPSYLEELDILLQPSQGPQPTGLHDRCYSIRQPVVSPPSSVRYPADVLMEIADRVGFLGEVYKLWCTHVRLKDPYLLDPSKRYTWEQIVDMIARSSFGPNNGLEWFKQNGLTKNPVTPEVAYPGPSTKGRIPIYLEHFIPCVEPLKDAIENLGLTNFDTSDYVPLPEWMPCNSYSQSENGDRDLIAIHYKLPYIYGAHESENPWLNELCESSDYAYGVLMNPQTAARKGIRNGDSVRVESSAGSAIARAAITSCIHPEVVGIAGHAGHWASEMPISRGKGINFNSLLPLDFSSLDKISTAIDHCVRVKVSKT